MVSDLARGTDSLGAAYLIQGRVAGNVKAYMADLVLELYGGGTQSFKVLVSSKGRVQEMVRSPVPVRAVSLETAPGGESVRVERLIVKALGVVEYRLRQFWRALQTWRRLPGHSRQHAGLTLAAIAVDLDHAYEAACRFRANTRDPQYRDWYQEFYGIASGDRQAMQAAAAAWLQVPVFRILVLCPGTADQSQVAATMDSLQAQAYPHFEVRQSTQPPFLHGDGDEQGRWHIAIRAGSLLAEQALFCLAHAIVQSPEAAVVYADHDIVDRQGKLHSPNFKPDWAPELLRASNYIGEAFAWNGRYAPDLVEVASDGAGLLHRLLLELGALGKPVRHVAAPLWHLADPAPVSNAADVVREHLARMGVAADVSATQPGCCHVRYRLPEPLPLISIVIPTRDGLHHLRRCIDSVLGKTSYPSYEILIVDNQSVQPETLAYFETIQRHPQVRVVPFDRAFNYSRINNMAVGQTAGEFVCLLNNDTEVISSDWLNEMAGHLSRSDVGVVGAKLLYGDGRVQHAGDTVGPGGCANHLHAGIGGTDPGYAGRALLTQELSAVTAACLLTRKSLYQALGGLNEKDLKVAFNDVDYCLRVRESGMRIIWTPHALLYHHESATRGKDETKAQLRRAKAEVRYMRKRWAHVMRHDPFYNPNLNYLQADFALSSTPEVLHPWRRRQPMGVQGA